MRDTRRKKRSSVEENSFHVRGSSQKLNRQRATNSLKDETATFFCIAFITVSRDVEAVDFHAASTASVASVFASRPLHKTFFSFQAHHSMSRHRYVPHSQRQPHYRV